MNKSLEKTLRSIFASVVVGTTAIMPLYAVDKSDVHAVPTKQPTVKYFSNHNVTDGEASVAVDHKKKILKVYCTGWKSDAQSATLDSVIVSMNPYVEGHNVRNYDIIVENAGEISHITSYGKTKTKGYTKIHWQPVVKKPTTAKKAPVKTGPVEEKQMPPTAPATVKPVKTIKQTTPKKAKSDSLPTAHFYLGSGVQYKAPLEKLMPYVEFGVVAAKGLGFGAKFGALKYTQQTDSSFQGLNGGYTATHTNDKFTNYLYGFTLQAGNDDFRVKAGLQRNHVDKVKEITGNQQVNRADGVPMRNSPIDMPDQNSDENYSEVLLGVNARLYKNIHGDAFISQRLNSAEHPQVGIGLNYQFGSGEPRHNTPYKSKLTKPTNKSHVTQTVNKPYRR